MSQAIELRWPHALRWDSSNPWVAGARGGGARLPEPFYSSLHASSAAQVLFALSLLNLRDARASPHSARVAIFALALVLSPLAVLAPLLYALAHGDAGEFAARRFVRDMVTVGAYALTLAATVYAAALRYPDGADRALAREPPAPGTWLAGPLRIDCRPGSALFSRVALLPGRAGGLALALAGAAGFGFSDLLLVVDVYAHHLVPFTLTPSHTAQLGAAMSALDVLSHVCMYVSTSRAVEDAVQARADAGIEEGVGSTRALREPSLPSVVVRGSRKE